MNFTFPVKITKQLILSHFTEEQIMEYYLRVPVKRGLFRSTLRKDRHNTCSFYRGKSGTLFFKDFATGQNLNIFGVVQELYHCSYYKALQIIANDFNLVQNNHLQKHNGVINDNPTPLEEKTASKIQVEIKDFSEAELKWWAKYGISLNILKEFKVYSCKNVFLNGELFASSTQKCPIYGYYGGKIQENLEKIELWKCYFPKRKEYRFVGNYPAKKLQGYDKLPEKGKVCVITKSNKDVMALYAYGIPACAPNSETIIPPQATIDDLTSRFKYVFALWDCDRTGVTFLNKMRKMYPQLHCFIIPRKYKAKDFSDLRALYGEQRTKELIIQYLNSLKNGKGKKQKFSCGGQV